MGQTANIIDLGAYQRAKASSASLPHVPVVPRTGLWHSDLSRLVPGMSVFSNRSDESVDATSNENSSRFVLLLSRITAELQPRFARPLHPGMALPAVVDSILIGAVCFLVTRGHGQLRTHGFNPGLLLIYITLFLIFALQENLYSQQKKMLASEIGAAGRAIAYSTLLSGFLLRWSYSNLGALQVVSFGFASLCALVAARWTWRALGPSETPLRNVLIVGSGRIAQRIADAIHDHEASTRVIKGFIAENHLRNVYGPSMFARIAREEFIDEIIVASTDPDVIEIAVQEARHNMLDISVVPQIPSSAGLTIENVGAAALLTVHNHRPPEHALALKRTFDVACAVCGLVVLSPVLLLIAAVIKLDSPGTVLYRAVRIGHKRQKFVCYKFRTMVRDADAAKDNLRRDNEREGAFFKIHDDPRVTRIGRLLRRYSLDELPQLWNVLLGHMSLVGPRPHPLDDASRYHIQHLQRLDFVPGITGLWQVTARRDPSFERSVALDVEYIKNWNLWLDARILWRTIFAVFEGSGA